MNKYIVVEVAGVDQFGQRHFVQVETQEHFNAVRSEFVERMGDKGLQLTSVKAKKVAEVWRKDEE